MVSVKIAVVEDDCALKDFLVEFLESYVHDEVISFNDAVSAWQALKVEQSNIDIIITDVNMPGMSGLDLLRKIRQTFPQKICILISGYPDNERLARALGADAYLAKPFKLEEFSFLVKSFLNNLQERLGASKMICAHQAA